MGMISVTAHLVDGSIQPFESGTDFLTQLSELQAQGLTGKRLIHTLITDDWAAPPLYVEISGTTDQGEPINLTLHYS